MADEFKLDQSIRLLHDAGFYGIHDETGHGFGTGLGLEFVANGFDRTRTQIDHVGDLLGTFLLAHEFENGHFFLAELHIRWRSCFHGAFVLQSAEQRLVRDVVEVKLIFVYTADRFVYQIGAGLLGDVRVGSEFQHF